MLCGRRWFESCFRRRLEASGVPDLDIVVAATLCVEQGRDLVLQARGGEVLSETGVGKRVKRSAGGSADRNRQI